MAKSTDSQVGFPTLQMLMRLARQAEDSREALTKLVGISRDYLGFVKQQQSLISRICESYDDSGKHCFEGKNA